MTLLSSGVRNNLFTLASNMKMMEIVSERVATGKSVNSAKDDPYSYFTARNLESKASDIDFTLGQFDLGSATIQTSIDALGAIDGLLEQADALVTAAADSSATATEIASYEASYDTIMNEINDLAGSAGFQGTNLLAGDDLSVTTESGTSVGASGSATTYASLGIDLASATNAGSGGIGWTDGTDGAANIAASQTQIDTARSAVQGLEAQYANDQFIMETRKDFAESMQNLYLDEVSNLTDADPTEEAANLTALQTRAQLAQNTLALLMQQQQGVLSLF